MILDTVLTFNDNSGLFIVFKMYTPYTYTQYSKLYFLKTTAF